MTKLKMSDKVELTLQELQDLFIAGQRFGRDYLLYEIDEVDGVTEPDFDEYIKNTLNIEI